MQPNDPTFGASFNDEVFKNKIRNTMMMGMSNIKEERATFIFPTSKTFNGRTDPSGKPYARDTAILEDDTPKEVQITCAVEFILRASEGTAIGDFNNPRVVITMFEEEYKQITGAKQVLLGGDTYNLKFTRPPIAMFTTNVYQIEGLAVSES